MQEYSTRPGAVPVLGVQVASDEADGLRLLGQVGAHFPSVHDTDNSTSAALHVPYALPASYVVDAGDHVHRLDPQVFHSAQQVDDAVRHALGVAG